MRSDYKDIELVLSALDETGQPLKTNITADPPIVSVQDNSASMINNSLYNYFSNCKSYSNYELVSDSYQLYHIQSYFYNVFSISA